MKKMNVKRILAGALTVLLTVTSVPGIQAKAVDIQETADEAITYDAEEEDILSVDEAVETVAEPEKDEELIEDPEESADAEAVEEEIADDPDKAEEEAKEEGESKLLATDNPADKVTINYWLYGGPDGEESSPKTGSQLLGTYYTDKDYYPELENDNYKDQLFGYTFCGWSRNVDYDLAYEYDGYSFVTLGETEHYGKPGDVIDLYAHWKGAEVTLDVTVSEPAKATVNYYPSEYFPETFHVGESRYIYATANIGNIEGAGVHNIETVTGYYVEGLYTDASYTNRFVADQAYSTSWFFEVNEDRITKTNEGKYVLNLYAKIATMDVELRLRPTPDNRTVEKKGKVELDKVIEALPTPADAKGYKFDGWDYYTHEGTKEAFVPGTTKYGDAEVHKDSSGQFYVTFYSRWIPVEYTINFHLNVTGNDLVDTYTCTELTASHTSLDVSTDHGVVSGNSSFTAQDAVFSGWGLSPTGNVEFDKGLTAEAIRSYAFSKGKTEIDVYAIWDGEETDKFILTVQAFDKELTPEEFAREDFSGSDYDVQTAKDLVRKDNSYVNENILLTGTEFVRQGYTLTGWTYTKTVAGNTTTKQLKASASFKETVKPDSAVLTAIWKKNSYTIKYNFNGGTAASKDIKNSVTYNKEDVAKKTALWNYEGIGDVFKIKDADKLDVKKPGYVFVGWFVGDVPYEYYAGDIYENLTLTAQWRAVNYWIRLESNGGIITLPNGAQTSYVEATLQYNESAPLKGVVATKDGYKFKSWTGEVMGKTTSYSANANLKNLSQTDGETVRLLAQWTPNSNTITYVLNGGKLPKSSAGKAQSNPTKYLSGEAAALIAPQKSGYVFKGWKLTQKGLEEEEYTARLNAMGDGIAADCYGNVTLEAIFEPETYTVNCHLTLDGSEYVVSDEYTYDETFTLNYMAKALESKLPADKRDSNSVAGFTDAGKKKYNLTTAYSKLTLKGTIDLFAQLDSKKVYRILYDLGDGALSKAPIAYTHTAVTKIGVPTRKGYVFSGWTLHKVNIVGDDLEPGAELTPADFNYKQETNKSVTIAKDDSNVIDVYMVAHWAPVKYTVKVEVSSIFVESLDCYFHEEPGYVNPMYSFTASKPGYIFVGMFTGKSGKGTKIKETHSGTTGKINIYMDGDSFTELSTKNNAVVNLYQYWIPDTRRITYSTTGLVLGDGGGVTTFDASYYIYSITANYKSYTVGKGLSSLPKVSVPGYTFIGWKISKTTEPYYYDIIPEGYKVTVSKGCVTKVNKDNVINITLAPCFSENLYDIKLNLNGGTYTTFPGGKARKNTGTYTVAELLGSHSGANAAFSLVNGISTGDIQKKGYLLKGLYLDSKGAKNLPTSAEGYEGIVSKNKGALTVYAVWEKAAPAKPTKVSAALSNAELTVNVHSTSAPGAYYEVEYSSSMLFPKNKTQTKTVAAGAPIVIKNAYNSGYYVRVKAYRYDSTGAKNYSAYSATARATRTR